MRWIISLVPALLSLSIGCPDDAPIRRTETRLLALKDGGEVRVKGFNGKIRVEGWKQEQLEVQTEIRENREGEITLKAESKDGKAEITAERQGSEDHGFHFSSPGVSYQLKVPEHCRVWLETSNGEISVRDLQGALEAQTSNARVELKSLGSGAAVRTSNGSIEMESIQGNADLQTSNASVEARDAKGELRIRTSNGSVSASKVAGGTSIITSNARVIVEEMLAPVQIETSNGSIRAAELSNDLKATTSNASMELQNVKGRLEAQTSNGAIEARGLDGQGRGIHLQTSHADITLDLGPIKGEIHARTSHHSRVRIERPGLEPSSEPQKGEAHLRVAGSDQRVDLETSDGDIVIQ